VTLLDSGSTTNFINTDVLRALQLATDPRPSLRVLWLTGTTFHAKAWPGM
jgi:hypothetical protein